MNPKLGRRATIVSLLLLLATPLHAQWWEKMPRGSIPRAADGTPDLTAPVPRRPDGKPDLSGIWEPNGNRYLRNLAADLKPEEVPFQPWAKALSDERADGSHSREDPDANCLPQGVPRIAAAPAPWKIVQTDDLIVVVHEAFSLWRQIFLDGRRLGETFNPTWLGYSTGTWDGDTLEWVATAHDPAVLAEPWELAKRTARPTDVEIVESPPCIDRSLEHMVDDSHHTNPR